MSQNCPTFSYVLLDILIYSVSNFKLKALGKIFIKSLSTEKRLQSHESRLSIRTIVGLGIVFS